MCSFVIRNIIISVLSIYILIGCNMARKVGSQAWFDRASQDTIISYYKKTCKSYGFTEGNTQMANCIQKEIHEGKKQAGDREMDAFWMFKSIGK